jgi:DNA end-binding protein Ku
MRTSIWKGSISFGLINIPITVQTAEQDKDLHFNLLDKRNLAPIKFHRVNAKTGKEVPNDQIIKGYQYEKGRYVLMTDADFKKANPKATQLIDIQDFVKLEDIDLLMFERPYYLVPEKTGQKAYFLLQQALQKSQKVAIAKVVMHQKEHLTCIFPRGKYLILEIMRFAHAIKDVQDVNYLSASIPKFSAQELKMAETLISDMTSKWKPEQYKDTYYRDLKKHIDTRVKAGKIEEIDTSEPETEKDSSAKPSKSTDLMALLQQSLAGGKKSGVKAASRAKKKTSSHSSLH